VAQYTAEKKIPTAFLTVYRTRMKSTRPHRPSHVPQLTFRFRAPRLTDLDTLLEMERRSFTTDLLSPRQMRHWITAHHRTFIVCECTDKNRRGQIAGYLLVFYRRNSHHARLYSIVIDEHFRGCGLARQLLARGEVAARKEGCTSMRLEVSTCNHPAIGLYEKLGYRHFGIYKEFYEDGGDALRMEKVL
jgi:ribosomal protein S18 acetylase RimI-like enzyme